MSIRVAPSIDSPLLLYVIALEPQFKLINSDHTRESNILYIAINLYERSWIEVMSIFKRSKEKKNLANIFTKAFEFKEFDELK